MGTEDYHYSDGFLQLDATGLNESMQGGSASRVAANINKKFPKKEEKSSGWGLSSLWGGSKKKPASNSTGASADLANSASDFESTAKLLEEREKNRRDPLEGALEDGWNAVGSMWKSMGSMTKSKEEPAKPPAKRLWGNATNSTGASAKLANSAADFENTAKLLEEKEKKKSSWFAEVDSDAESDGSYAEVDSEAEDDLAEVDGENEQWELLADSGVAVGELAYDGLKGIGSGMSSLWNRATKSKKKPTKSASTVAGNIAKGSDKGLWGKASPGAASTVAGNIAAGPKRI